MKEIIISMTIVVLIISILVFAIAFPLMTVDTVQFTVSEKERVIHNRSSKYLIFSDEEIFQNTDCLMHWKFDSSDLYGKLKVGESYEAEVYGWRIHWMSKYRNIISIKRLK